MGSLEECDQPAPTIPGTKGSTSETQPTGLLSFRCYYVKMPLYLYQPAMDRRAVEGEGGENGEGGEESPRMMDDG